MKSKLKTLWRVTYLAGPVCLAVLAGHVEWPKLTRNDFWFTVAALSCIIGFGVAVNYLLTPNL